MQKDYIETPATKSGLQDGDRRRALVLGAIAAIATFFCIAVPRISPLLIVAFTFSLCSVLIARDVRRDGAQASLKKLLLRPETLFLSWVLVACIWSSEPIHAYVKAVFLAALVLHAYVIAQHVGQISMADAAALSRGLLAGFILGGLFVCFEIVTRDAIARLTFTYFPEFDRGFSKHVTISGGVIKRISGANITRSSAAFCFFWVPASLATTLYTRGAIKQICYIFLIAFALIIFFHPYTRSQSAQLAIPAVLASFALAMVSIWLARWAIGAVFAIVVFMIVPISLAMFAVNLHNMRELPNAVRARVIIWNYTAERILVHPFLGVGTNSTRFIHEERVKAKEIVRPKGFIAVPATRAHPHNIYLQIWYELGIIGAAAFAYLGVTLLKKTTLFARQVQPFILAHFAMCAVLITPTYGLWQSWFQSIFVLSILALILVAKSAPSDGDTPHDRAAG